MFSKYVAALAKILSYPEGLVLFEVLLESARSLPLVLMWITLQNGSEVWQTLMSSLFRRT